MNILTLHGLLHEPLEPEHYISYPLIPKGGRAIIGAPKKYKKSFLAMNLAYDLAEGERGRGLWGIQKGVGEPLFPIFGPVDVLYIEQEIGQYRVRDRLTAIHNARNGEYAPANLRLVTKGKRITLGSEDKTGGAIRLDTDMGLNRLRVAIESVKKPDRELVVIFDPLRKFHTCEENDSTGIIPMILALDQMQEDLKFATVFVHHTGKRSDYRNQEDPEALRGSSVWGDDADSIIMMSRPEPSDCVVKLNFTIRSAEDPKPVTLDFNKNTFVFEPRLVKEKEK